MKEICQIIEKFAKFSENLSIFQESRQNLSNKKIVNFQTQFFDEFRIKKSLPRIIFKLE